ncbi:MAG: hypothetical protein EOO23_05740 [Comamonadaceae bacterium]|nr:MAG: hypothetical protein EOO23_05740 [Comamonadaceae bacterium]
MLAALESYQCAGIELTFIGGDEFEAKLSALRYVVSMIRTVMLQPDCWVIAGHHAPQPDSRIVRHKKLWASLGLSIAASDNQAFEWPVRFKDGLRFFGAVSKALVSDELLLALLEKSPMAWLVVGSKDVSTAIKQSLSAGWVESRSVIPDSLLMFAQDSEVFLIRDFGPTDDLAQGAIVVSRKKFLDQLNLHSVDIDDSIRGGVA